MTYAVIMQYPGDNALEEKRVEFFDSLERAVAWRDRQHDHSLKVFRVEPVSESALYDWAVRKAGSTAEPMVYVNERAARNCCPDGAVIVKRRLGTVDWAPAPREDETR